MFSIRHGVYVVVSLVGFAFSMGSRAENSNDGAPQSDSRMDSLAAPERAEHIPVTSDVQQGPPALRSEPTVNRHADSNPSVRGAVDTSSHPVAPNAPTKDSIRLLGEGEFVAPGYALERSKVHSALLLAGEITAGVPYGISLIVGAAGTYELLVPVAGPWFALHRLSTNQKDCASGSMCSQSLVADGMFQLAGTGLIIAGLLVPKYARVAQVNMGFQLAPVRLDRNTIGLGAFGRF